MAGLKRILLAAAMAASSSPWPRPRTTRFTCNCPFARELHFKQDFAFQFQISCFVGINRIWLVRDLDRRSRGTGIHALNVRRVLRDLLRAEA